MGRPTAIARLLRRARSAAAASSDGGNEDIGREGGAADDFDLESGIAEIFATIRSGAGSELLPEDLPEDTGATYALLSKLDQLWQSPEPKT